MRLRWLFAFILLATPAFAQQGNTVTTQGSGAPVGNCAYVFFYVDFATGNLYDCKVSAWNLVTGAGGGSPGGVTNAVQINSSGSFAGVTPPASPNCNLVLSSLVVALAAVTPTWNCPGVPVNAQTGTTYNLASTDRFNYVNFTTQSTATLQLCQITGSCANNFSFVVQNLNTGALTIAACTTGGCAGTPDQIDGANSISIPSLAAAFIYQDSTSAPGHWFSLQLGTLGWAASKGFAPYIAFCNGVIGTANATEYLLFPTQTGTANLQLCTITSGGSISADLGIPMPLACTMSHLSVHAAAAGGSAGSGLIKIYKNGSGGGATALTCTLGTGKTCTDNTHNVSFAAGDIVAFSITTGQATDSTASPRLTVLCQ